MPTSNTKEEIKEEWSIKMFSLIELLRDPDLCESIADDVVQTVEIAISQYKAGLVEKIMNADITLFTSIKCRDEVIALLTKSDN